MLEAKLNEAAVLKKLLDAAKELVTDANFECNDEGLQLQAMDNSHVALVAIHLEREGFRSYRCDHPMPLGINLGSLTKVLKCSKDDDVVTIKAEDNADVLSLKFEAKGTDRVAEYDMKLMDIDQDQLGIPDTEYESKVRMPSSEFARICRELASLGESVRVEVNKEGVRFNSEGDIANGSVLLKPTAGAGHYNAKKEEDDDDDEPKTNGSSSSKKKKKKVVEDEDEEADEDGEPAVKKEKNEDDVEMEEDDGGSIKDGDEEELPAPKKNKKKRVVEDEEEAEQATEEEEEEEELPSKKRKRKSDGGGSKKTKKAKKDDDDDNKNEVAIQVTQAVSLSFSLKYLINFSKASSLCTHVELCLSADVPLLCAFKFEQGYINYYLAPKIGDE